MVAVRLSANVVRIARRLLSSVELSKTSLMCFADHSDSEESLATVATVAMLIMTRMARAEMLG